jgi:hypothetical protein
MKTIRSIVILLIVISFSSCITIKKRQSDDGSSSLARNDSSLIMPYDENAGSEVLIYNNQKEIKFQMIDAEKLIQLTQRKPFTWILIGASWCGISKYARLRFCRSIKHFAPDSIQLIIIDQDFDLKELQKQQFNSGFNHITYLLDPERYGSDESYKQERFIKESGLKLPIKLFEGGGVPKSIVVDNDLNIHYYASGMDVTSDTISKYTGLKKIN